MRESEKNEFKAKNYVYRLLAYRNRSQKEIKDKLKKRKYSQIVIDKAISDLRTSGYIDDARFAREWTQFRLNALFGLKKIALELRQKGIDEETAKSILGQGREKNLELDNLSLVANKKIRLLRNREKEKIKIKAKLYRYLLSKGFSSGDITTVLDNLISR